MDSSYQELKSVNTELTLFLFGEDGLVYSNHSGKVYWLNALGVFVWLNLEEGCSEQEILEACSVQGISHTEALSSLISELRELFSNAELIEQGAQGKQEVELGEHWLDKISFSGQTGFAPEYKILDVCFNFQLPDKGLENLFRPLLEQFKVEAHETQTSNKNITIKIIEKAEALYQIEINQFIFSWEISEPRLLSFMLDRIRKLAFNFSEYQLAIHAAVLAKDNSCIVFPAMSYSGKSTLAAALIKGDYQYLSDEIAVLDENFCARALPLGLGLKEGSWQVLERFLPDLDEVLAVERWDGVPMKYLNVNYQDGLGGAALSKAHHKVTQLVFPQYTQGAQASLSSLSVASALYELFQAGYTESKSLCLDSCRAMIDWLSDIPKFKFVYDDLDSARECLGSLK